MQILLAIALNALSGTSDTFSDMMVFKYLCLVPQFWEYAVGVAVLDIIPGVVLFLHHVNTPVWKQSSLRFRIFSVIMIPLQPFSLLIIHVVWIFNVGSEHWHNLARISQLIHGSFEAPSQTIMLMVLIARGVIETPWEEYFNLTDRNGNNVALGKIGTASLVLCGLSLLKGSVDVMEFDSYRKKWNGFMFSIINLGFRLPALALIVTYLDIWATGVFIVLFLVITAIFLYIKGNRRTTIFNSTSSIALSVFLPISASRCPHELQKQNQKNDKTISVKEEDAFKRKISSLVSLVTLPIIYLPAVMVWVSVKYLGYQYDPNIIIAEVQLEQITLYYLTPMFALALVSSVTFYPTEQYGRIVKYSKILMKYLALIGTLGCNCNWIMDNTETINKHSWIC